MRNKCKIVDTKNKNLGVRRVCWGGDGKIESSTKVGSSRGSRYSRSSRRGGRCKKVYNPRQGYRKMCWNDRGKLISNDPW